MDSSFCCFFHPELSFIDDLAGLEVTEALTEACVNALESFELVKQVSGVLPETSCSDVYRFQLFLSNQCELQILHGMLFCYFDI